MTRELIEKMFEKQNDLNNHTNGINWKDKNIAWYRAIWTECAEMIDHTNWKWWWKNTQSEINMDQVKLELIDIWHFGMSDLMINSNTKYIQITLEEFQSDPKIINSLQEQIEYLTFKSLKDKKFDLEAFRVLCKILDMSIDDIYKLYIGKNVLNRFRQDHGYKQGIYIKIWNEKEDNDYMMEIIKDILIDNKFEENIYTDLEKIYKNILTFKDFI